MAVFLVAMSGQEKIDICFTCVSEDEFMCHCLDVVLLSTPCDDNSLLALQIRELGNCGVLQISRSKKLNLSNIFFPSSE